MSSTSNSSSQASTWKPLRMKLRGYFLSELSAGDLTRSNSCTVGSVLDGVDLKKHCVSASQNGFVWAALHAYHHNLKLFIRPDDVWLSILAQLGPSLIRYSKRTDMLSAGYDVPMLTPADINVSATRAREMDYLIERKLLDPTVKGVLVPKFSTTNDDDITAAAVLLLGKPCKKYTEFEGKKPQVKPCIKSVNLLGNEADWTEIIFRLSNIQQSEDHTELREFSKRLISIIQKIVLSFREPQGLQARDFWANMVKNDQSRMSGDYITGWLSAFCYWKSNGVPTDAYRRAVEVGGVSCWKVRYDKIPVGIASMPIKLNDKGRIKNCTMIGGMTCIWSQNSTSPESLDELGSNIVQPSSGWLLYSNNANGTLEKEQPAGSKGPATPSSEGH